MQQQDETPPTTRQNSEPDYSAIEAPTTKPQSEYTYTERRADLLQIVEDVGHPAAINQAELADRYDVDQSTISRDLDRLEEFIRERIGKRRDLEVETVFKRAITGLLEQEEYAKAARAAEKYDEFLDRRIETLEFRQRLGRLEEAAERQEGHRG